MVKAYWIAQMDVTDPDAYESYKAANAAPFAEFGARFLVRGGMHDVKEGQPRTRQVVIEFPNMEAARACYASEAYQAAKSLRADAATGDLVIVEGFDA